MTKHEFLALRIWKSWLQKGSARNDCEVRFFFLALITCEKWTKAPDDSIFQTCLRSEKILFSSSWWDQPQFSSSFYSKVMHKSMRSWKWLQHWFCLNCNSGSLENSFRAFLGDQGNISKYSSKLKQKTQNLGFQELFYFSF